MLNPQASYFQKVAGLAATLLLVLGAGCTTQEAPPANERGNDAPVNEATANEGVNEALLAAAWDNDVSTARDLISRGADVNYKDSSQQSAYLVATSEGYLDLLELTLANGADVASLDSYNGTGLIRAAERGHHETVARLLATDIDVDHINNLGWTALHEAIILGDGTERYIQTVQLLLDNGADPALGTGRHHQSPLELALSRNQSRIAELLETALG